MIPSDVAPTREKGSGTPAGGRCPASGAGRDGDTGALPADCRAVGRSYFSKPRLRNQISYLKISARCYTPDGAPFRGSTAGSTGLVRRRPGLPGARVHHQRHVETLFGRRIHTPEINVRGPHAAAAQRQAINAPIQGSAADIIRRAMIRVPEVIDGLPARMLLQVHDELLFEVAEDAVDETVARVRTVMSGAAMPAVALDVPLVVDAGAGQTWAAAH